MKKFLSALVASVFITSSVFTTTASAIIAEASTPRIYVDIVYESDTQIRADVMFKNVPPTANGGFHLNIADGWKVDTFDNGSIKLSNLDCTGYGVSGALCNDGTNDVFICYACGRDIDMNGRFCSLEVSKTDTYSETNSDISVYFTSVPGAHDWIGSASGTEYFGAGSDEEVELPVIEKVNEYIIGDANGDVDIDARDSSAILRAIYNNGDKAIYVSSIESNFTRLFPSAKAPAAPDANNDGYISDLDAKLVLNYYSDVSTSTPYVGTIGSKAIYEYYSD